jgi:hypothetical protein
MRGNRAGAALLAVLDGSYARTAKFGGNGWARGKAMEVVVVVWVGCAVVSALAAQARGRSFGAWLVLGLMFGVFALLAVLVMGRGDQASAAPDHSDLARANLERRWAPVPEPPPQPGTGPSGTIAMHRGMHIVAQGDRVAVGLSVFKNVDEAVAWIDRQLG